MNICRLSCLLIEQKFMTTGFTPVMFGRSPNLPVDVVLGRTQQDHCTQLPHYVRKLQQSVKAAFSEVHQRLVSAH